VSFWKDLNVHSHFLKKFKSWRRGLTGKQILDVSAVCQTLEVWPGSTPNKKLGNLRMTCNTWIKTLTFGPSRVVTISNFFSPKNEYRKYDWSTQKDCRDLLPKCATHSNPQPYRTVLSIIPIGGAYKETSVEQVSVDQKDSKHWTNRYYSRPFFNNQRIYTFKAHTARYTVYIDRQGLDPILLLSRACNASTHYFKWRQDLSQ